MAKREKLWKKAQESPQNLTFDQFETLLRQTGWTFSFLGYLTPVKKLLY